MRETDSSMMPQSSNITSKVETQQEIIIHDGEALLKVITEKFPSDGKVVVWLDYKVCFGLWQDNKLIMAEGIELNPLFLEQLRVFNTKAELYLWRTDAGIFSLRTRNDEKGNEKVDSVDAYGLLWGQVQETVGEFSILADKGRNLRMVVPRQAAHGKQLYLQTRNYIVENEETGQVGYGDSRFVDIVERG